MCNIIIMRKSKLQKLLRQACEVGFTRGSRASIERLVAYSQNKGIIQAGIDINKEAEKILEAKDDTRRSH